MSAEKSLEVYNKTYETNRDRVMRACASGHSALPGGMEEDVNRISIEEKGGPVEDDYYRLLEVESTATATQIKKAYYRMARDCHPDRSIGDVEAKRRFQRLSEVYQVLGDSSKRAKYDKYGEAGLDEDFLDPAEFYNINFGMGKS